MIGSVENMVGMDGEARRKKGQSPIMVRTVFSAMS